MTIWLVDVHRSSDAELGICVEAYLCTFSTATSWLWLEEMLFRLFLMRLVIGIGVVRLFIDNFTPITLVAVITLRSLTSEEDMVLLVCFVLVFGGIRVAGVGAVVAIPMVLFFFG